MFKEKRIEWWDGHHIIKKQGDSEENPLKTIPGWKTFQTNKDVLEIGPGEGRQYDILSKLAKSYAVAGISNIVLEKYKDKTDIYLIEDYAVYFQREFDVINAFYVFHHVLEEELEDFVYFLKRHLRDGGHLCCNIPTTGQDKPDGRNTTKYVVEEFKAFMIDYCFEVVSEKENKANNYVMVLKKLL